jgi:hypothetical protein
MVRRRASVLTMALSARPASQDFCALPVTAPLVRLRVGQMSCENLGNKPKRIVKFRAAVRRKQVRVFVGACVRGRVRARVCLLYSNHKQQLPPTRTMHASTSPCTRHDRRWTLTRRSPCYLVWTGYGRWPRRGRPSGQFN